MGLILVIYLFFSDNVVFTLKNLLSPRCVSQSSFIQFRKPPKDAFPLKAEIQRLSIEELDKELENDDEDSDHQLYHIQGYPIRRSRNKQDSIYNPLDAQKTNANKRCLPVESSEPICGSSRETRGAVEGNKEMTDEQVDTFSMQDGSTPPDVIELIRASKEWKFDDSSIMMEGFDNLSEAELLDAHKALEPEEETINTEFLRLSKEQKSNESNSLWKDMIQKFEIETDVHQCYGCGIRLQTQFEDRRGYVEKSILSRTGNTKVRCQRCSSMHSGEIFNKGSVVYTEDALEASRETVSILRNSLSRFKKDSVTIVYVMDVLDLHFERGLVDLLISREKPVKLYIVVNKIDLLPLYNRHRILHYIHKFILNKSSKLKLSSKNIFLVI